MRVSRTAEYRIWNGMKQRCLNPNSRAWHRYGGRGIGVCKSWMSFQGFYRDMGRRPSRKHSIDRINNDLGYSKDNCRWATMRQQAENRADTIFLSLKGRRHTLRYWAKRTGLQAATLYARILRGWPVERVLNSSRFLIKHRHEGFTIPQWAKKIGVSPAVIYRRLKMGWSFERAVSTPKIYPGLMHGPRAAGLKRRCNQITFRGESMSACAWSRKLGMNRDTIQKRIRSGWPIELALTTPRLKPGEWMFPQYPNPKKKRTLPELLK